MTTAVILQPSYIPWRGYFDLLRQADVFVFYDDVQYDKHGWRNRNRVKTANGPAWLTVPVHSHGAVGEGKPIHEIEIAWHTDWAKKQCQTLQQAYAKRAPFYAQYMPIFEQAVSAKPKLLVDLTIPLTISLASALGISHVRYARSSALGITGDRVGRLLAILQHLGATRYLSGPSAEDYLEPDRFAQAGIALEYIRYDYPEYTQLYPPFDPQVSVLDLLFMAGPQALSAFTQPTAASQKLAG